jgi:pimeloyl-ACP methyl ester carboxylesterase
MRDLDDLVLAEAAAWSELGLDAVHVVGHSFGALVAASFAALFPERARSLTLITPAPLPTVTSDEMVAALFAGLEGQNVDAILLNDNHLAYPDYLDGDDAGESVSPEDGTDPYADPSQWDPRGAPALYRRLRRVTCPSQIIVPDEDRLFGPEIAQPWSEYLGGASMVTVTGDAHPTGHLLIVQEPVRIAERIRTLAVSTTA